VKQWFRFLVIFLPVVLFPLYQLMVPHRGDVYFRIEGLLDSNKWLFLDLWGGIPVFTVLLAVLAITTIIFIIQELVPLMANLLEQVRIGDEPDAEEPAEEMRSKVSQAFEGLPFDEKLVEILSDDDPVLFSSTGLNPKIFVSTGLIKSFSTEHLQAAFAHEIGHIQRSRRPLLILAYILRVLMFYNPIAMLEFRRLAQEEEKVCDDIAVALTGKPEALSEAIEMLRPTPGDYNSGTSPGKAEGITSALEHYSQDVLLKSRLLRIRHQNQGNIYWGIPYCVALVLIIGINYFVV
jgi:Zn-dependent protease with chaperone function